MAYKQSITKLNTIEVTAGYPYYSDGSEHGGIDYVTGDHQFYSPVSGTVVWAQEWDGYSTSGNQSWGNMICVEFATNRYVLMAHFAQQLWQEGATIQKGELAGVQGETGNAFGIHTHVEYWDGGQSTQYRQDPASITGIPNQVGTFDVEWDAGDLPTAQWHAKSTGGYEKDTNEAYENTLCAWGALKANGWTLEAFCGFWGNVGHEGVYNPWRWQDDDILSTNERDIIENSYEHGYGLAGFTPSGRYIYSDVARGFSGFGPNFSNQPGDPNDGNAQVLFVNYEGYYTTDAYPMPFSEYKTSTASVDYLTEVWMHNYERPASYDTLGVRQEDARYWYNILQGVTPPPTPPDPPKPPTTEGRKTPLWMLLFPF